MNHFGPLFRTPAEVRAIPREKWETWVAADAVPWDLFQDEHGALTTARWIAKATKRRMEAA